MTTPIESSLPPGPSGLRAGTRWVPDTVIPLALSGGVRAALQLFADSVLSRNQVSAKRRKAAMSEQSCRKWLNRPSNRSRTVTAAQEQVDRIWHEVAPHEPCPIEVLGFTTTLQRKDRPDDFPIRYRVDGREHRMWVNHKSVSTTNDHYGRIASVRGCAASAAGDVIARCKDVPDVVRAAIDAHSKPLASLVAAVIDDGTDIHVRCYEPLALAAFGHLEPDAAVHPSYWIEHTNRPPTKVYAKENALLQICHHQGEDAYGRIARALIANNVSTADIASVAMPEMFRQSATQFQHASIQYHTLTDHCLTLVPPAFPVPGLGSSRHPTTTSTDTLGIVPGRPRRTLHEFTSLAAHHAMAA
jgi:hypothetical protein